MLHISDHHPVFGLQKDTQAITQEFLSSLGLSYFQYLRCFDDGSVGLLVNYLSLLDYLQQAENEPVIFSSFQETDAKRPSYWFLWDEMLPEKPVSFARNCHFHQGITWVRRFKKYYDMIAVALAKPLGNPGSFYLNYQNCIEQIHWVF